MKKFFIFFIYIFLFSSISLFSPMACRNSLNPLVKKNNNKINFKKPENKDIIYYQNLIKDLEKYIFDCNEMIVEVENNKDNYQNDRDYQNVIDEIKAQKFNYQASINNYQYQILILENSDDELINSDQVVQAILIFNKKVFNLEQELKLREKYPDYYTKHELQVIKDALKDAKNILKIFLKIKEEKNVTINFSSNTIISRC